MPEAVWGIIPAAGSGTRLKPLAFSKELLPVGSRREAGTERPRAVGEYLVARMVAAGATRLCFVISPEKWDIVRYFGAEVGTAPIAYVVQPRPSGLCDAVFRAVPLVPADEDVVIGLPDTIWFPENGLALLPQGRLALLLFPVERPELFDAVEVDAEDRVRRIWVKEVGADSRWVWGAMRMPGRVLRELHDLWLTREPRDEYLGTLISAYLARGGEAAGVRAGTSYVDVGTMHGYREALTLLRGDPAAGGIMAEDR